MVNVKAEVDSEVPNIAAQLVVQMIRIRDVSGSNIGLRVGYPHFDSRFSSLQAKSRTVPQIRSLSFSASSFFSLLLTVHSLDPVLFEQ